MTSENCNLNEEQLQTLSDSVMNDYLSGNPDDEPDVEADERFKRYVLTVDDDPLTAALEYFASADVSPFIHEFLAQHGLSATFADLWNAMDANQR